MEPAVPKEFLETCDENYIPDNSIFMKEELIITDVANQPDNEQNPNIVAVAFENIKTDENQLVIIPNNVDAKLEESISGTEPMQEDDDIVIISEEKPLKNDQTNNSSQNQSSKKNGIVPEIAEQMLKIKTELKTNKKVPLSIVFVKKCRICQKVQKESRSQSMIKCQYCESRCFLFQCLLCFKRYTTFLEVFAHIDKKHKDKVYKESTKKRSENDLQQLPSKGIKVTSNKCLTTNEKFQFNSNGYTSVMNQPSTAANSSNGEQINENKSDEQEDDDDEEDQDSEDLNISNNYEVVLKEDIPLKQTELDNPKTELFNCTQCGYSTLVKRYYQDHVRRRHTVIDPKNYKSCAVCSKKFRLQKDLKAHSNYCGKEPKFKCKFCDYKSKHPGTLKVHMQRHIIKADVKEFELMADVNTSSGQSNRGDVKQEDPKLNAAVSTSSKSGQVVAVNQIKSVMQVFCNGCNKISKVTKPKYRCPKCDDFLIYRCKSCQYSCVDYNKTFEHVMRVHFSDRKKSCPRCDKIVIDLKPHLKHCGVSQSYSCEHCTFKTKYEHSYINHTRNKHQTDPKNYIKCGKCNKEFAVLNYLLKHQKYYCDTEKAFGCAHCSLKTRSKGNLIRHIRLLHMETISDVKFTCQKCKIDFHSVYMYDKHLKLCSK